MGLINWVKGVYNRMFNKTDVERVLNTNNIAISNEMINAIQEWKSMYVGQAYWTNEYVKSLRLEQAICREFVDVMLSEMECKVTNNRLNEIFQDSIENINEELQLALGLGSLIIKPINQTDIEIIHADSFIPVEFDSKKRLKKVLFIDKRKISDTIFYTRFEYHTLDNNGLTITQKCFKSSSSNDIGHEVPLSSIDDWSKLLSYVNFPNIQRQIFGYFRVPLKNTIDGSATGISIFESGIDQIRNADETYENLLWEFESGKRAVFADRNILKSRKMHDGSTRDYMSKTDRLFKYLDVEKDNGELLETYSPEFRESSILNSLQEHLRRIEFAVGLSYGDLSNPETVDKTAEEIKASKNRKYNRINALEKSLKDCLDDLVYAIAFYNALTTSGFEFVCKFNDSIIVNEEIERQQDRQDLAAGIISKEEYRAKWKNEDLKTAKANLPPQADIIP